MKREVERERRLPAFDISKDDLELLVVRMQGAFDSAKPLTTSIEISLPNEKLQFDSIDELKAYVTIKGRVTKFSIRVSQGIKKLSVNTGGLFSTVPTVKAEADTEIWCAGALEAVENVIRANKVWYGWFIYWPLVKIQLLLVFAPLLIYWLYPPIKDAPSELYLTWIVVLVMLTIIAYPSNNLLPPATISFTNELSFIRRYGAEIGFLLGLISIALGLLSIL